MDVQALLAADASSPLGRSRAHVLDLLRAAGSPVGVRDVAARAGLHPNTARFHLDALASAGLASRVSPDHPRQDRATDSRGAKQARATQALATPGRPAVMYEAVAAAEPAGTRRYRLLAEMLAGLIGGMLPEPGAAAADAGRQWGRYLTDQPAPYERVGAARAIEILAGTLDQIGFAPEVVTNGARPEVRLRRCPFQEVAEKHQDVVCQLHLGLMRGVLEELRAPVTADRLQPFAEPGVCVAYLSAGQPPSTAEALVAERS
jgi:predicted ArsR family transcriptional regulator